LKPGRTVEMTGARKTRKTKPRFPFVSHSPWKSLRDSHIPTAPAVFVSQNLKKPNSRKEPLRRVASLPPSGSFFNEKMLLHESANGRRAPGVRFALKESRLS
jgi:hypothetical protein